MNDYYEYLKRLEIVERKKERRGKWLPILLMAATVCTTIFAGALMQFLTPRDLFRDPVKILQGATFAVPLMLILFTHEMGHFLTSKVHRVKATLPYFIPFPNYIGTFGAVIKMKSPMNDRRALMDIGAAGPLAGFALSLIACMWGVTHLQVVPLDKIPELSYWNPRIAFGNNLALLWLYKIFDISLRPGVLYVNPILDAGWLGMFVTSLNLLPAGQLDGGHISYALFGERGARWVARTTIAFLFMLGLPFFLFPDSFWIGWVLWGLIITVMGLKHPAPENTEITLDFKRKLIGVACLIIFIISFTPMPFHQF